MAHRNLTANHIASPSFGIDHNSTSIDQNTRKNLILPSDFLEIREINSALRSFQPTVILTTKIEKLLISG